MSVIPNSIKGSSLNERDAIRFVDDQRELSLDPLLNTAEKRFLGDSRGRSEQKPNNLDHLPTAYNQISKPSSFSPKPQEQRVRGAQQQVHFSRSLNPRYEAPTVEPRRTNPVQEAQNQAWQNIGARMGQVAETSNAPKPQTQARAASTSALVEQALASPINKSPIILDLNGDGIELSSSKVGEGREFGIEFDIDPDRAGKEQTAWTQGREGVFDDAFLVLERDGKEGVSGLDLFGDQHGEANGYAELAKYDDNNDGKIDSQDKVYSELRLWADMDHDGEVGGDEMRTLEQLQVTSISTSYSGEYGDHLDEHKNDISLTGEFTRIVDGEEKPRETMDAFFVVEPDNDEKKAK